MATKGFSKILEVQIHLVVRRLHVFPVTQEVGTQETEPEVKETIVDRIGSLISHAKNAITGSGSDEQGEDIPDEFTEAMTAAGYDDAAIEEFAGSGNNGEAYTNEQLLEMIPSLVGGTAKADATPEKTTAKAVESEISETKVEDSQEGEELKQALARIAVLEEKQGVSEKQSKEEELNSFVGKASDLFDKVSEEFEVFGKTEDLPTFPDGRPIPTSPQMKARVEVWDMAVQLREAGIPNDKALEFSFNAYKGAHLATETKRNVIKGLKKQEQKLGGKRVSHEASSKGDLTGPQVLQAVARKHGQEMPD